MDTRTFSVLPDAFYVRNADGVWLRNNIGSFSIRGAGAYELVDALFANLDGRRTVADVCAGLPGAARDSVVRLVDTLSRNGFVREITEPAEPVPGWMAQRYGPHLALLDQHANRPVTRMMRVRSRLVACTGDGVALRAVLSALADFGVARVSVSTSDLSVADAVAEYAKEDQQFRWVTTTSGKPPADADILLVATDGPEVYPPPEPGIPVGVLARCGGFVVSLAPGAGCWECVRRSVAATPTAEPAEQAAAAPATIAALHLVQHTFAQLAEVELPGAVPVISVETVAPAVRTHTTRRHPLCDRHPRPTVTAVEPGHRDEPVRPDIPAADDDDRLVAVSDRIVEVTTAWTDPITGPLYALGEGDADQLPLSVSTCRVTDPAAVAAPESHLVVCRAISAREARNQVVLYALEWLAAKVAARLGEPPLAIGAGWTPAEAWYRTRLAVSATLSPAQLSWEPVSRHPHGSHPIRGYLADTLRAAGREWVTTSVEQLTTGLVRARVRTADFEVATGLGVDAEHAVRDALLHAVAVGTANGGDCLARLAPPVATWAQAAGDVDGEVLDASGLLPFLDGEATVLAARLPDVSG